MAEIARLFPDLDHQRADPATQRFAEGVRIAEALLFAASEPLAEAALAARMPEGVEIGPVLAKLRADYAHRGVHLVRVGPKWLFRTADDLSWLLSASGREVKKLSRAALETLAIIAYHQPATRAEIEDIRGVAVAKGTIDTLLETGWIKLRGRRRAPGRPVTYGTTEAFLLHFGLEMIGDLPGLDELKGAGLIEGQLPPGFTVPLPHDGDLKDDEDPLGDEPVAEPEPDDDLYPLDEGEEAGEGDEAGDGDEAADSLGRDPFA
jgi:segregation and condensation protein B